MPWIPHRLPLTSAAGKHGRVLVWLLALLSVLLAGAELISTTQPSLSPSSGPQRSDLPWMPTIFRPTAFVVLAVDGGHLLATERAEALNREQRQRGTGTGTWVTSSAGDMDGDGLEDVVISCADCSGGS